MAEQESWTEHQEQKKNPDKHYDSDIEFTEYLYISINLWVSEKGKVSYVNMLGWDAECGTCNDIVISGVSKSVCVNSLDFNADYFKW